MAKGGGESVNKRGIVAVAFAVSLIGKGNLQTYAMEAPGDGEPGWYYGQEKHRWYYVDGSQNLHTGWLDYNGEWYWFNQEGWMADGGTTTIDGIPYYFFINGNLAWNQYVGMKFYNKDGRHEQEHDVRVVGKQNPDNEDKDMFSDYMYQIPRSWITRFIEDGWQIMFYKQKKYFEAPRTDQGIYYVYHSVDTYYKKMKFTDVDSVLQAFGEYVGYAAGCYEKGNAWMDALWEEQPALSPVLNLPDRYVDDGKFYFGKLFAAYVDDSGKEEVLRVSPRAGEVMEEILHLHDDEETKKRLERKAQERQEAARQAAERAGEGGGPGIRREEKESDV
ncbi:hypothetical protein D3Z51_04935 [Clostridiaceae bacterium]|nr:hypothetical protein [Clostridiaceae bacterium]RKI15554.1 hypothetical protein D7V81_05920 [bacterium 1XD21-70]